MVPFLRGGGGWGGGGVFGPLLLKILFDLAEILVSNKRNTVFEKSFNIPQNFGSNGMHPKFTVLVHFRAQFTAGKPKILLKTKISAKTTSLQISNNVSPRSQKNHRILVKLSKKTFLGPKVGLNCPLGLRTRNSHIAYNMTIHLYFLDVKLQLLGLCCSQLYLEETTTFFWFKTQLGQFFFFGGGGVCGGRGLGTITPVNVKLSDNFDHR